MPTKSNTLKPKSGGFKFHWWMAVILVAIVAVIGIAILRFSHASNGNVYIALPSFGQFAPGDPALSTYSNQDAADPTPNPKPGCPPSGETVAGYKGTLQVGCLVNGNGKNQELIVTSNQFTPASPNGRTVCLNVKHTTTLPPVFEAELVKNNVIYPFEITVASNQTGAAAGNILYCQNLYKGSSATIPATTGFNTIRFGITGPQSAIIYSLKVTNN
jgi:hypothetical protein